MRDIPYFNGTLFNVVTVEELKQEALDSLAKAAKLNWASVEPSIFGTLFERSLASRQTLATRQRNYTSRDDILLIVEPVLMQPLALRMGYCPVGSRAIPRTPRHRSIRTRQSQCPKPGC